MCVRDRVCVCVCVCVWISVCMCVCARVCSAGTRVTCIVASLPSCFLSSVCMREGLSEFLSTPTHIRPHTPSVFLSLALSLSLSLSLSLPLATQDMRQHIDTTMAVHTSQVITNLPAIIQGSLELAVARR